MPGHKYTESAAFACTKFPKVFFTSCTIPLHNAHLAADMIFVTLALLVLLVTYIISINDAIQINYSDNVQYAKNVIEACI